MIIIKTTKYIIPVVLIISIVLIVLFYTAQYNKNKTTSVIYITKTIDTTVPFWNHVNKGMESALKEVDMDFKIYGADVESQVELQNEFIRKAIAEKPSVIILAATNYNSQVAVCEEIVNSGIKLITVDSNINSDVITSFIGTDNFEAGRLIGVEISKVMPTDGKLLVMSYVKDVGTSIVRESGLLEGLTESQKNNISGPFYSNSSVETSKDIVVRELSNNPNIKGIVGLNGPTLEGVLLAVKELKLENTVKIVGMDSSINVIKGLEDGTLSSLIVQNPFNMGYLSIISAHDIAIGKKIPNYINTGIQVVTKENMYLKEYQKSLFIFEDNN